MHSKQMCSNVRKITAALYYYLAIMHRTNLAGPHPEVCLAAAEAWPAQHMTPNELLGLLINLKPGSGRQSGPGGLG